jgi:hypothetical protein
MGLLSPLKRAIFGEDPYRVEGYKGQEGGDLSFATKEYMKYKGETGDVTNRLRDIAFGRTPSIAEKSMQLRTTQALRGMSGQMAGMGGGVAPGLQAAMFAQTAGQTIAQTSAEAGIQKLREQQMATNALAAQLAQMRAEQITLEQMNQRRWEVEQAINAGQQPGSIGAIGYGVAGAAGALGQAGAAAMLG